MTPKQSGLIKNKLHWLKGTFNATEIEQLLDLADDPLTSTSDASYLIEKLVQLADNRDLMGLTLRPEDRQSLKRDALTLLHQLTNPTQQTYDYD